MHTANPLIERPLAGSLSFHGDELQLFWAKASPLLIHYYCRASDITARDTTTMITWFWPRIEPITSPNSKRFISRYYYNALDITAVNTIFKFFGMEWNSQTQTRLLIDNGWRLNNYAYAYYDSNLNLSFCYSHQKLYLVC